MKKLQFSLFALGLVGIMSLGLLQVGVTPVAQAKTEKTLILEVAQDASTLALNQVVPGASFPPFAQGDVALVNGNIYPGGTIPPGFDGTFDPDAVPDIGTWRCLVAVLGEFDLPLSGAVTYYFSLGETEPGTEKSMLIVQGLNSHLGPASVPRILAIVGGTGEFSGAAGEVREEVIGTNTTGAFNLRYQITLKKQAPK
jgi:hypothetical protein